MKNKPEYRYGGSPGSKLCETKRLQDTAEHPAPGFYQVFTKALGQSRISSLMLKESKVGSRRALPRGRTKSPCQRSTIRGFPAKVRTQESIKAEEEVLSVMAAFCTGSCHRSFLRASFWTCVCASWGCRRLVCGGTATSQAPSPAVIHFHKACRNKLMETAPCLLSSGGSG